MACAIMNILVLSVLWNMYVICGVVSSAFIRNVNSFETLWNTLRDIVKVFDKVLVKLQYCFLLVK